MIEGKRVKIQEPHKLKLLLPYHRLVREIPIVPGKYIYISESPFDFERFPDSVWVSRNAEIDLNNVKVLLQYVIGEKAAEKMQDKLLEMDGEEMWNVLILMKIFNLKKEQQQEEQIYKLFQALNKSNREIYRIYKKIRQPIKVILASLLTMLLKAKDYKELTMVSRGYLRQLASNSGMAKRAKPKLLMYWLSEREETDFIYLLFSLRK